MPQMRPAAWLMYASGALHFLVPVVAGFTAEAVGMIVPGLIWIALGFVLLRFGWRWLAWLCFFLLLAGSIAALTLALGAGPAPTSLGWAIFAVDVAAVAALFGVLWGDRVGV